MRTCATSAKSSSAAGRYAVCAALIEDNHVRSIFRQARILPSQPKGAVSAFVESVHKARQHAISRFTSSASSGLAGYRA
jgi:hypothetical protein